MQHEFPESLVESGPFPRVEVATRGVEFNESGQKILRATHISLESF
jgi:hypothetical protein